MVMVQRVVISNGPVCLMSCNSKMGAKTAVAEQKGPATQPGISNSVTLLRGKHFATHRSGAAGNALIPGQQ
jgi:hypothetical protein